MAKSDTLHITNGVELPLDAITRTFAALGQRGTGKTSAAVVMAEEMLARGGHVVILDPVGVHWGITRPGTGKGYPGVIIGGEHADVPLEETAGALVAELVVGRHWPVVVVDMKLLRKGAQRRFMADFLEGVYFHNRQPLHVIFEEADQALPQTPRGMDPIMGRVLGAGEDIVKLGRSRGLGVTLVSQRPATVNKNVLEQVESLFLFRLMGPRDRKSAREWVEANADPASEKEVMDSLASLQRGECWLWAPGWLRLLKQIQIRPRRTFDSSATPEIGEKLAEPQARAPIDLDVLRQRMAETIERAKAEDPKTLRARIRELERDIQKRPTETKVETKTETVTVEIPVLGDGVLEGLSEAVEELAGVAGKIVSATNEITTAIARLKARPAREVAAPARPTAPQAPTRAPVARPTPAAEGTLVLGKAHRSILSVLIQRDGLVTSKRQLAVMTGYSIGGGGFNNPLGALRTAGMIEGTDPIAITDHGTAAINEVGWEPLPTGDALLEHWSRLGKAHRLILHELARHYPDWTSKQDLADATGYEASGGGFNNPLGKLRTLELIEGTQHLRLTEPFGEQLVVRDVA